MLGSSKWVDKLFNSSEAELQVILAEELVKIYSSASPEHVQRLKGLQWRIDRIRAKHSNPTASMLEIYSEMMNSLHDLKDVLNNGPKDLTKKATVTKINKNTETGNE